jgi:hypothetical protein
MALATSSCSKARNAGAKRVMKWGMPGRQRITRSGTTTTTTTTTTTATTTTTTTTTITTATTTTTRFAALTRDNR